MMIKHVGMLYGLLNIIASQASNMAVLVYQSWWSSYLFEYYEMRFTFTPAALQLHYGRYVIQHCRPHNRRQLWVLEIYGAKTARDRLTPSRGGGIFPTPWGNTAFFRDTKYSISLNVKREGAEFTTKCHCYSVWWHHIIKPWDPNIICTNRTTPEANIFCFKSWN